MNVQQIAKWAVYASLFLVPFLALYISSSLYFPFITGKNFAFRVLVEIAVAGWIVLALADKVYRPRLSVVGISFALLIVWMAIANSFGMNPHKAFWSNFERMEGWVTLVHVFAFFLVAGSVFAVDHLWEKWRAAFVASAAIVTGYGLLQIIGAKQIHQSGTRIDASLGNAEYLAGYLLFAVAFTLWQALDLKKGFLRYSLFVLTALELLVLFKTGTRGTFVALVAALVFGGFLWLIEAGKKGRKGAAIFLGIVLIIVGGFWTVRDSAFVQNDPNLARIASISIKELGTRLTIWDMALEGAKERPVLGWGQEGFNYVFNKYYEPSLYAQEPWFDRAHNIYIDWLIAGGAPALILFLLLFGSAIWAAYRLKDMPQHERILILAAFAGYGVQGLVVFDNLFTYVPLAFLLAYVHARSSRPVSELEKLPQLRGTSLDLVAAPIIGIATLLVIYFVNVPNYIAAKELIKALTPQSTVDTRTAYFRKALDRDPFATQEIREQLLGFAQSVAGSKVPEERKREVVVFAREQMEQEIERAPEDARLHILYASFLRGIGDLEKSREESARAHELSPKKQNIIVEQGIAAWQAEDLKAALAHFEGAYALEPENDEAAAYFAAGQMINGDVPAAKAFMVERFGTTTVDHLVFVLAYQQVRAWNDLIALLTYRYDTRKDAISGYQLASAYAQVGRFSEARALTREIMAKYPESASNGSLLLMQIDRAQ